jgi:hypothetical protein
MGEAAPFAASPSPQLRSAPTATEKSNEIRCAAAAAPACPPRPPGEPARRPVSQMAEPARAAKEYTVSPELLKEVMRLAVYEFLHAHTRSTEGSAVGATELFGAFNVFCRRRGLPTFTQRRFGDELARRGYMKDRRAMKGRVRYLEIQLIETGVPKIRPSLPLM